MVRGFWPPHPRPKRNYNIRDRGEPDSLVASFERRYMSGLFEYCKFFVGDKCRVDEILVWSIASFKTHLILKIPFKHLNTPKKECKNGHKNKANFTENKQKRRPRAKTKIATFKKRLFSSQTRSKSPRPHKTHTKSM